MKTIFFDFETFSTWWCVSFGEHDLQDWSDYKELGQDKFEEKVKSEMYTITSDDPDYLSKLNNLFYRDDVIFSGYNIKHFDLVLLNGILKGFTPIEVKRLSDLIINEDLAETSIEYYRLAGFVKRKFNPLYYIDMFNRLNGSLKDFESLAGLDIEESGVDFNLQRELTQEEKDKVIFYNKHDVYATMEYCRIMKQPSIEAKYALAKTFNLGLDLTLKNTNAIAVSKILGAYKQPYSDENELVLDVKPKVKEYVYRNVPAKVYDWITTSKSELKTECFGNQCVYGNGGIHSVIGENIYVEPAEDEALFNMDVVSFYPGLMIQLGLMSRSVPDLAMEKFKHIFTDRLAIKRAKVKTTETKLLSKAYKLVLNTTYGTMGDKYNPMYDLYHCSAVCRHGQLLLTALACRLTSTIPSFKIIQSNTDGILCLCKKADMDKAFEIKKEWEEMSGLMLDVDYEKRIWQKDVNNYIMEDEEGELKIKGGWFGGSYLDPSDDICGALYAPIVKRAAIEFLTKSKDPIETVAESHNIMDFVINCKKGPGFYKVVHMVDQDPFTGQWKEIEMNRSNRILPTTDKYHGCMYKVKRAKGKESYTKFQQIPEHCLPLNKKITTYNFETLKSQIDYRFILEKITEKLDIDWKDLNGNVITRFNY